MHRTIAALALAGFFLPLVAEAAADGRDDFKRGDFVAAERAWTAAGSGDSDAIFGLAQIRLYQDRRPEAVRLARAVPATDAQAPKAAALIAEAGRRDAALDPAEVSVPAGGTRVPFVTTDPLPILKVRLNGKADAYFFLDTGAAEAILDPEFAKELGLSSEAAGSGTFAGGKSADLRSAVLDSLALGEASVRQLPVKLLPTRGLHLDGVHRLDGIIGTGILYRFLATIDYPGGALVLRPRAGSAACERRAAARHDVVAPMWLVGDHFIFARAQLNDGPERLFNIDTGGAGVGVMPSPASLADSHVTLDTANAGEGQGGGGAVKAVPFTARVRFATIVQNDVQGVYTPEGNQFGLFPFEAGGALSHLFFRPYAVTFDFVAMKLVVSKP